MTLRSSPNWVSAVCAAAASSFLLLAPVYGGGSHTAELGPGDRWFERVSQSQTTLVAASGSWVYLILAVPVVLAAMPLLARRRSARRHAVLASTLLLLAFVFVTGFSVGLLYAPSALAMVLAVLSERRGDTAAA